MIIKEIQINNFPSYYGSNHLSLSKGLTLIIGDNGDGKTTLFEALEWLFDISCACLFVYAMKLGIIGVFMAVIVDEGVRAFINLGRFMHIMKKMEFDTLF